MPRVKRGVTARARHKKVLKLAKGYYGARSRTYRVAKQAVTKAGQYAYRDRRQKKRQFRQLWIARINAASPPLIPCHKFPASLSRHQLTDHAQNATGTVTCRLGIRSCSHP